MRQTIVVGYIALALMLLTGVYSKNAVAAPADNMLKQCILDVREFMNQERIKGIVGADQRKAIEYCKRGEVKQAINFVRRIGTMRKCVGDINRRIKHKNLKVDKEIMGRAHMYCRRGESQKAIEAIDGGANIAAAGPAGITSFDASNDRITKGESVTLSWNTKNADTVMLSTFGKDDYKTVQPSGSVSVAPDRTTTYLLMAGRQEEGGARMIPRKLTIRVLSDPKIFRFSASKTTIRRGLKSKLIWDVYDVDAVSLNGIPVSLAGEKTVSPAQTKNYALVARSGDKSVTENVQVHVSPFKPASLSPPFSSVELCRKLDKSGRSSYCVSPDGPFWVGGLIHVLVRFNHLPKGKHQLKRIIYSKGVFGAGKWRRIHQEKSAFQNSKNGYGELSFEIPREMKGVLKLELVLDNNNRTKSTIPYCIECPGFDEW